VLCLVFAVFSGAGQLLMFTFSAWIYELRMRGT